MGLSGNENKCSGACAGAAGRYSGRVSGRKRSHNTCFRTAGGNAVSESSPAEAFQASRDCILLAAAYLFGTLMAGVLQALCDAEEMETLAYYLDCWRGVFAASSAAQAVGLFGAELAVVLGAAAVFLLLGLSAVGPLPIFLFAMLYGTGSGLLSAQLLDSSGQNSSFSFCSQPASDGAGGGGALPVRSLGSAGQQPHPRLLFWQRRKGKRQSASGRSTAPGGAIRLTGGLSLPALRCGHRPCVSCKSSDAGRISARLSCGLGPDVV